MSLTRGPLYLSPLPLPRKIFRLTPTSSRKRNHMLHVTAYSFPYRTVPRLQNNRQRAFSGNANESFKEELDFHELHVRGIAITHCFPQTLASHQNYVRTVLMEMYLIYKINPIF